MSKLSEQAARNVYERMRRFIPKRQIQRTQDAIVEELAAILDAEYAPVIECLRTCQRAIQSLPTDALGQDSEIGHFYRDELLAQIEKTLENS